jgi:hypothetical protein
MADRRTDGGIAERSLRRRSEDILKERQEFVRRFQGSVDTEGKVSSTAVDAHVVTMLGGRPHIFKGQEVLLTLEDWTDTLSRKVDEGLPMDAG